MMFARTFALMNRALTVEHRLLRTHLFRLALLAFTYILVVSARDASMRLGFGAPGLDVFRKISMLNFFSIVLAGVSFFSSAITEEKEEMTLGLLRMAGINPVSLLLGKSIPRLIIAIVLLTAQLPFTLLAITLGGVALSEVVAVYVCLLSFLLFVANLGLLFSVVLPRSNGASSATGIFLGVYSFGPYIGLSIAQLFTYYGILPADGWLMSVIRSVTGWITSTHAFMQLISLLNGMGSAPTWNVSVASNLVAGATCFLLAWLLFDRCCRNEVPAAPPRGLLNRRWGSRGLFATGRVWKWALCWKDFYFNAGGRLMFFGKFILWGGLIWLLDILISFGDPSHSWRETAGVMIVVMTTVMLVEGALLVSRTFSAEVRWQTLSSLMLLPISTGTIAYHKLFGSLLSLVPAACYLIIGMVISVETDPRGFTSGLEDLIGQPEALYVASQYLFLLHLAALMSLHVKWGALPLSLGIMFVGNFVLLPMLFVGLGPSDGEAFAAAGAMLTLLACGAMQLAIGTRLRTLAAQG